MKKKSLVYLMLLLGMTFIFNGCTSYNLSIEKEDIIAEYAADILLQSQENYEDKLLKKSEIVIETETPEPTETETGAEENPDQPVSISNALGMDGFLINYKSYDIVDTYTEAVVAGEGMKIIVLKFEVTNVSDRELLFDLEPSTLIYSYKGTFNGERTYNAQITLLLNALNSYKENFSPGQTTETVLIYKAPTQDLVDGITEISLTITTDETSTTIKLQ